MVVSAVSATSSFYAQATPASAVNVAAALVAARVNPRARVSISDTAENIARNFDALARVTTNITAVEVSDGADDPPGVMTLTASQLQKQARLLAKFSGSYALNVTQVTAANAATIQSRDHVLSFSITDNSSELSRKLDSLASCSQST